jgi:hypothetical protein
MVGKKKKKRKKKVTSNKFNPYIIPSNRNIIISNSLFAVSINERKKGKKKRTWIKKGLKRAFFFSLLTCLHILTPMTWEI